MMTKRDSFIENTKHLENPRVGDYWHEMFSPYFIVLQDNADDTFVICDSFIHELDYWRFSLFESRTVTHDYLRKTVKYSSLDGFVADCTSSQKLMQTVKAWQDLGCPRDDASKIPDEDLVCNTRYEYLNNASAETLLFRSNVFGLNAALALGIVRPVDASKDERLKDRLTLTSMGKELVARYRRVLHAPLQRPKAKVSSVRARCKI